MARLTLYSTERCPICDKSKTLLTKWGIPYDEVRLDQNPGAIREFTRVTNGARSVPQFVIDGRWIGGFSELTELHMEGELDELAAG